jgi:serine/threonine-protein kinase RsbW
MHRELAVPLDTSHLARVRKEVMEVLGDGMFTPVKANLIALAVDEAVANIMEHAYGCQPGRGTRNADDIVVVLDLTPEKFSVIIRDRGTGFDPREAPEVNMQQHIKAGRKSGLGIFLIRRIMDEVNYALKENSHNELQLVKYVDEAVGKAKSKAPELHNGGAGLRA